MDDGVKYVYKPEQTIGKLPCECCGKPVTVVFPFIGCVYCGECVTIANGGWTNHTSQQHK